MILKLCTHIKLVKILFYNSQVIPGNFAVHDGSNNHCQFLELDHIRDRDFGLSPLKLLVNNTS